MAASIFTNAVRNQITGVLDTLEVQLVTAKANEATQLAAYTTARSTLDGASSASGHTGDTIATAYNAFDDAGKLYLPVQARRVAIEKARDMAKALLMTMADADATSHAFG